MTTKKFDIEKVISDEDAHIKEQRKVRGYSEKQVASEKKIGLAISGGGIRSASFGLGVIQALEANNILKKVDYMSTVSGGGYIGSCFTWCQDILGSSFPFGQKKQGARTSQKGDMLDYLRQHGNYLTPNAQGLERVSLLGVVLRNAILSLGVYILLTSILVYLLILLNDLFKAVMMTTVDLYFTMAMALSLAFVIISSVYGLSSVARLYSVRVVVQALQGVIVLLVVTLLVIGSLPSAKSYLIELAASTSLTGVLGTVYQFYQGRSKSKSEYSLFSGIRIWLVSLLLFYGLLLFSYCLATHSYAVGYPLYWFFTCLSLSLFLGLLINTNQIGLGKMYRDRLMETFLPNKAAIYENRWMRASKADQKSFSELCRTDQKGPFHIINTNVVLVSSDEKKYKNRGGDSFIFSSLYCGSNSTSWYRSSEISDGSFTLATAMAISGAALNPNTGVAGQGITRNRLVSFMLSIFNIRLGYWLRNPNYLRASKKSSRPNLIHPGISQGIFGRRLNEKSKYLELSDGGHFDNTGAYELIRRKCEVIILSEAGADPNFSLDDLSNLIEKVRVDFGAYIRFRDPEFDLSHLIPGSYKKEDFGEFFDVSNKGYALAKIDYSCGTSGIFVFLKTTMITKLPGDLYGYKAANPDFPNQSTADQFFDEAQFEAYRELGYRIADSLLKEFKLKKRNENFLLQQLEGLLSE